MDIPRTFGDAFKGHRAILIDKMDVSHGLLNYLLDMDVITRAQKQDCESAHTDHDRVSKLLDILERRPDSLYQMFCQALDMTGQSHIVDTLRHRGGAGRSTSGVFSSSGLNSGYRPNQYSSRPPQYSGNFLPGGGGGGGGYGGGGSYGSTGSGYYSQDIGRGDAGRSGMIPDSGQQLGGELIRLRTELIPEDVQRIPYIHLKGATQVAEGGFGIISRASHIDWGTVAYKKLKISVINPNDRMARELQREVQVHVLRHPNIVAVLGVVFEPGEYGIVMEYATFGGLDVFIDKYKVGLMMKMSIAHGIVHGMNYLHSNDPPVIHGDLKTQNVLVSDGYVAKICDFGLSKWKLYSTTKTGSRTMRGTVTNIPPENWRDINQKRTTKYDVYGFGILMYELLSATPAFVNAAGNADHIKVAVLDNSRPDLEDIDADDGPKEMLKVVKDIIKRLWAPSADDRPPFGEIKSTFDSFMATFTNELAIAKAHLDGEIQQYSRP